MFKKFILSSALAALCAVMSAGNVKVYHNNVPVLVGNGRNVVCEISVENDGSFEKLTGIEAVINGLDPAAVTDARLVYSGTMSCVLSRTTSYVMQDMSWRLGGGLNLYDNDRYVIDVCRKRPKSSGLLSLKCKRPLVKGMNYFYISLDVNADKVDLAEAFTLDVNEVNIDRKAVEFENEGGTSEHRFGVSVRTHGDDGVYAYRIPGLVTTNAGTLIGTYDVRHNSSLDLQDDIDIGVSRSTDGGKTWEKMRIVMDMGEWGGLPHAQNGIGDPSILVDENTGEIFIVAVWTHGLGNNRAWSAVDGGMEPETTAQLMMTSSRDDGKTWSKPRNLTKQVKVPHWKFTLQGPGRGITMQDGTLVFPLQYIDSTRVPNACIMYSCDHGRFWKTHNLAKTNTTESQVAEIEPGLLMLNMRDNRGTGRAVYTTDDMGRSWKEHCSSGQLQEPVCQASLLNVPADKNVLGKDVLLFSNPNTSKGRHHITIKASLDKGVTWQECNQMLLDAEVGWGYSCMTMLDDETIGILYEGSNAQLVFQAVKLRDVVR